jgi:predicted acetyltransferase
MTITKCIDHFIKSAQTPDGFGMFYKNIHVTELAKTMSGLQIKKYKRHGIVPAAIFIWLREAGVVNSTMQVPHGGAPVQDFLALFKKYRVQTEQRRSTYEHREQMRIQKYCAPVLNKAFGNQDGIWDKIASM